MNGDFNKNLNALINGGLEDIMLEKIEDACQLIENEAKEGCPVDDGTLKASINHKISKKENKLIGVIGTNVEYAPYVHEGTGIYATDGKGRKEVPWVFKDAKGKTWVTKGQKPKPFLKETILNNEENIKTIFKDTL